MTGTWKSLRHIHRLCKFTFPGLVRCILSDRLYWCFRRKNSTISTNKMATAWVLINTDWFIDRLLDWLIDWYKLFWRGYSLTGWLLYCTWPHQLPLVSLERVLMTSRMSSGRSSNLTGEFRDFSVEKELEREWSWWAQLELVQVYPMGVLPN